VGLTIKFIFKEANMLLCRIARSYIFDCPIFRLRRDTYVSTTNNQLPPADFFIFEPTDWVNIIALTPAGEVVLVTQHRYGSERVTWEIPGGMIDPGESPLLAAQRELIEETGYSAQNWELLGCNEPNPAIQSNKCYTFLAQTVRLQHLPDLDPHEDLQVQLVPLQQIPQLIANQTITHALVIAAFYFLMLRTATLLPSAEKLPS
jgi:8-oxo-dGTP pyrophosphatase MutT (NUDIX family)